MVARWSSVLKSAITMLVIAVPTVAGATQGQQSSGTESASQPSRLSAVASQRKAPKVITDENTSSHVLLSDGGTAHALRQALREAWKQLGEAGCQGLLSEFKDKSGNPLTNNLSDSAGDLQSHLGRLVFVDGTETRACATGALAVTEPGSRVVRVCSSRLVWTWQQNPRHVIAGLIHEALHTLGLGENPPSSREITSVVLKRCGTK
jgi:hypothetical protein